MRVAWLPLLLIAVCAHAQRAIEQAREYERRTAIQPDMVKVSEAAKTPETLWAFLLDPMTTYDDRMAAAAKAAGILPPSYIAKKIAVEMELDTEPPAIRALDELTIDGLRQTPWPWQVQRALRKIWIDRGHATGFEIARELPCGTDFEANVVIRTLGWFPMTAESYGLLLNVIGNRDEAFRQSASIWLGDLARRRSNDERFWANQALVAKLAPTADRDWVWQLSRIVPAMREKKGPMPFTAFLAVADRMEELVLQGDNRYWIVRDAPELMQVLDPPPFERDPKFNSEDEVMAWMAEFHRWLESHRSELEKGAAAETIPIAAARARMDAVTLCR